MTGANAVEARSGTSSPSRRGLLSVLGIVVFGAIWEAVATLGPDFMARPSRVAGALPAVVSDPAFWSIAGKTFGAVAIGLSAACIVGTLSGLVMGQVRVIGTAASPYLGALYSLPMVAITPLLTVWFGFNATTRLAVVFLSAIFPITLNALDGSREAPADLLEVGRSFRSGRALLWRDVVAPSALPFIMAGVRLAAGRALVGAVVAEFLTATEGLGYYILFESRSFRQDNAMVGVILLASIGLLISSGLEQAARRLFPWTKL